MIKNGLPNLSYKNFTYLKNEEDNQGTFSDKNSKQKTISEYEGYDEININNENPFYDEPDAPKRCIRRRTKYYKKKFPQKALITSVKTYILEDGSEQIVIIEEVIFDD